MPTHDAARVLFEIWTIRKIDWLERNAAMSRQKLLIVSSAIRQTVQRSMERLQLNIEFSSEGETAQEKN